ncbi:MAG: WGR domain-containing protein [Deltaproteobacteria bacterium]|nr:WGR domain-containing protein [Deltaproteobacteria bacterium]
MGEIRSIQLFFQEGSSDKVYNAQIIEDGGAFTVKVQWGRRGASLSEGAKAVKVARAVADKTFDKLVREKRTKGYEEIAGKVKPAPIAPPDGEGSGSKSGGPRRARVGLAAQLLEPIDEDELARFIADDTMVAQQKLDGIRVVVTIGETLVPTNRDGQVTKLASDAALSGLRYLPLGTVVDGEVMGEEYWMFDLLMLAGTDVRGRGYVERWEMLENELEPALTDEARILPVAIGKAAKQKLYDRLRAASAEGMVFKDRHAGYKAGRNATQRKLKFIKACDVVILENAGNAYQMAVYDGKKLFEVGRVFAGTTNASRKALDACLGNGEQPVCEVKYLYATADDQLFQPVFVRMRDDKPAKQCVRAQLKKTDKSVAT